MINEIINSPELWSFGFVEFILAAVLSAFAVYFFFEVEEASILVFFGAVAAYYTPSALLYIGVSAPWSFLTFLIIWFIEIILFCIIWFICYKIYVRVYKVDQPKVVVGPNDNDPIYFCSGESRDLIRQLDIYWLAEKADPSEEIEDGAIVYLISKRNAVYLISKNRNPTKESTIEHSYRTNNH